MLKPLNADGALSGTGNILCPSTMLCVLITTDGTNAATVTIRKESSTGDIIYYQSAKTPVYVPDPVLCETDNLYYSISGTGAKAQLFEYLK